MSKEIKLTPHELILVELCVRQVFSGIINKDKRTLEDFSSILQNIRSGIFGYRDLEVKDEDYNLETSFSNLLKKILEIQKIDDYIDNACDACGCMPCDCDWGV